MKIYSPVDSPILHNGFYVYKENGYTNRDMIAEELLKNKDNSLKNSIVNFNFHDDFFSKLDWTKEPSEDIEELYRQRAQQLRDKYNYLILSYSGGSDSQQILDVFLKYNIFLDEVQTICWDKSIEKINKATLIKDKDVYQLLEYEINVVPNLKILKEKSPNTKIRVLDTSDFLFNDVLSGNFEMIGIKNLGAFRGLFVPAPRSWTLTQSYHMNKFTNKDKVALIHGIEKPHLNEFEGKFYFRFSDSGYFSEKFVNNKLIDNSYRTEYFYWSPDFPKIPIKQSHILKNEINSNQNFYNVLKNIKNKIKEHHVKKDVKAVIFDDLDDYVSKAIYPNSRTIYDFNKPLKIGPEYMLLSKYHDLKDKILPSVHEALSFRKKKYDHISNHQLKTSLVFSKSYYIGDLNPSWNI